MDDEARQDVPDRVMYGRAVAERLKSEKGR